MTAARGMNQDMAGLKHDALSRDNPAALNHAYSYLSAISSERE